MPKSKEAKARAAKALKEKRHRLKAELEVKAHVPVPFALVLLSPVLLFFRDPRRNPAPRNSVSRWVRKTVPRARI